MRLHQAIVRGIASTHKAVTAKAKITAKTDASIKLNGSFICLATAASNATPAEKAAAWISIQTIVLRFILLRPVIRARGA